MTQLQYLFHKLIISKYNNLYKLLIFLIIYLFLYPINCVFCMTENSSTGETMDLLELIEEQEQFHINLSPLPDEINELQIALENKDKEKQEIIDHYTFLLNEEAKKLESYKYRTEILVHENAVLRRNQELLLSQKRYYQLVLHNAKQTIASLTGENLDLRLNIAEQKRKLQLIPSLPPSENKEIQNLVVEITENSSPIKKRK